MKRSKGKTQAVKTSYPPPATVPRNIRWAVDYDYNDTLPADAKAWLAKFTREYYDGSVRKGDKDSLHITSALRRDCYNRKNLQNRDMHSIYNANGRIDRLDSSGNAIDNGPSNSDPRKLGRPKPNGRRGYPPIED